ncbi:MAG TPA: ATP-binding protein [Solirubrobacter sp.]
MLRAVSEATLVALQTESLGRELRESRARLVTAADAERRRLGRDLHDSAQQRLVALRMRMGESAEGAELDRALSELRALAGGLYPPLLSRYGVAAALEALARVSAIPVKIDEHAPIRYSDSVESTAYFCCLEALQNAAKHAGAAATATVRLLGSEEGLRFDVTDDGDGFDVEASAPGAGLRNLADRLEAVGGTLEIDSAPGNGTRVTGFVPAAGALAAT